MLLPNYGEGLVLYRGQAVFVLGADWRSGDSVWPRGSLVSIAMRQASSARPLTLMMTPGPREMIAIQDSSATSAGLLVTTYSQVRARLQRFTWVQGQWQREAIPLPDNGTVRLGMSQSDAATAFVTYESFLRPQTLYRVDAKHGKATPMASTSSECGNGTLLTEQLHAESPDGTSIPYFVTRPGDLKRDAEAPTLMLGYGASGAAETATYNAALCQFWLIRGGVYVVANIRGGGELGPAWNLRGAERRHTYEDFIAVAEDLIKRKITMPRRLGILGASSGGLLMGVMYNQRPDLFNAIVIQSPVLDLFRNDLLMGGAAVTIFGSAEEPRERAFMEATSPYQNLRARAEAPIPFIMTNTSDDNVHPAMARRFAAKMQALNLPFFYYEAPEGGHGLWSTPEQRAQYEALFYTYLMQRLMD
jgi:prolyl oligopeptidase